MSKGFFHPERGYWETITNPSEEIVAAYPIGTVETPLRPSHIHTWGGSAWVQPTQEAVDADLARSVRSMRDEKLMDMDEIVTHPLRWAALDADTQAAWAAYRQALLDVPAQAGFPHNVTWPEVPST